MALRILGTVPDVIHNEPAAPPAPEDMADLAVADLGTPPELEPGEIDYETGGRGESAEGVLMAAQTPYLLGPTVPNFRGKTLRAVVEETSRKGIPVEYVGAGVARSQYPPPGAVLPVGERVLVEFAR